jgi:hypothetical protein
VSEPFAPVFADRGWRDAAPGLARLADQESDVLARALTRVQREAPRYATSSVGAVAELPRRM